MAAIKNQRVSQGLAKWSLRMATIGLVLGVATAGMYFSVASQSVRRVKLAEIVGKNAPGSVLVDGKNGAVNREAVSGQAIATQAMTKIAIQQTDKTNARLGENSLLTVENDCLQLGAGQAIFSATPGCLGAVIVSSSNGVYSLERLGSLGEIKVLSGQVNVTIPSNPAIAAIVLQANQKITVSLAGDEVGPVRLMLPTEVESVLKGELFQAFQMPLANQTQIAGVQPPPPTTVPKQPTTPVPAKPAPSKSPNPALRVAPASVHAAEESDEQDDQAAEDKSAADSPYSRLAWRKRGVNRDRYSYRRRWRIPYTEAAVDRRRAPSDSEPEVAQPAPSTLPAEHPHSSTELPPAAPPMPIPLPPPIIVEPPLAPIQPAELRVAEPSMANPNH